MNIRTRLTSWSLPVLLFGVPLCAALALEHASAAGQKDRSRHQPSQRVEIRSSMPVAPAAAGPKVPESSRPLSR